MRTGSVYIILYLIVWIVVLCHIYKKTKVFGISVAITLSYILYTICSMIIYNDKLLRFDYHQLTFFPFLYLFLMLYFSLQPAIRYDKNLNYIDIKPPNEVILKIFLITFIISSLYILPNVITHIREGLITLMIDAEGGADLYREAHTDYYTSQSSTKNIPFIIHNIFLYIVILCFFYCLTRNHINKVIMIGMIISIIIGILYPISKGLRTNTIMVIFAIISAYLLLKKWMSPKRKKIIISLMLGISIPILILLSVLTVSRFGDSNEGSVGSVFSYTGQCNLNFNNYGLDAGGIRYGDRTCRIFKEILGFDNVPNGVVSRRFKYPNLWMDDYVFYTFVGDFTIDFGPIIGGIIIILFSLLFCSLTKPNRQSLSFSQLIIVYFAVLIPFQGGMYLFNFSDGGNYTIMAFVFSAFIFNIQKIRY